MTSAGWFTRVRDDDDATEVINEGTANEPANWPDLAVEAGFAPDVTSYYKRLHEATVDTARAAASERERAPDQQLVHAIRGMDDLAEQTNELRERLVEWSGSYYGETGEESEYVASIADRDPTNPTEERIVSLASRVEALDNEREGLSAYVEREAPSVAPNLSALAGPLLAARLIALAGGLEPLARKPSGTLQVLGAEDALFAHLEGRAPSPKHGVIYTHEYVRNTRPEDRGSAARALAGKLTIAARIDHYSGERKPEIDDDLEDRMDRIRSRGGEE